MHQAPNKTVTSETQQPLRVSLWHSCFLVIMHLTSYISTLCCIMLLWFWQLWHFLRLKSWQNGKIQFWVFIHISQSQRERASSAQLCVSWDVVCKGDIVQLWLSEDQHSLRIFHKMCFMNTCALKMCLILVFQNIPAQRVQLPYLTFLSFNEGSKNIYSIIT